MDVTFFEEVGMEKGSREADQKTNGKGEKGPLSRKAGSRRGGKRREGNADGGGKIGKESTTKRDRLDGENRSIPGRGLLFGWGAQKKSGLG